MNKRRHEGPGQPMLARALPLAWSGLQDCLDLEVNVNLVGDHDAAAFDRRVVGHAEVAPVDVGGAGKAGPGAAVGVRPETVDLELERHVLGDALERQLTVKYVAVT